MNAAGRASALRRYPALAFLVVAAVLAVALPSALTLPNAGPPTLAEFAPVPGHGQDAGGDLGRLGSGTSGGVGFGSGDGSAVQPGGDPGQPGGRFKRCVGSPARQTEDPLSPPCVAFFEGDNGGATARGVTGDEVKVIAYLQTVSGGPAAGALIDFAAPVSETDSDSVFSMKTYAKYFNERYQAYGRRVHLYGLYGVRQTEADVIPRRRADGVHVADDLGAFATVPVDAPVPEPFVEQTAARGVLTITYDSFRARFYRRYDPYLWSFLPALEEQARMEADYVCRKLAGRTARHSGDPTAQESHRVFGIVYTDSPRQPVYAALKDLVKEELSDRCGIGVAAEAGASDRIEEAQGQAPTGIATLRTQNVTTVLALASTNTVLAFTTAASGVGWIPEWFVPGRPNAQGGVDRKVAARLFPAEQWRHAFGLTFLSRWGSQEEMHWSRSYRETCNGCEVREPFLASIYYDALQLLFYGIQSAGPRLTVANVARGLRAIPERPSPNEYAPAAYFTTGSHSYLKDAMHLWWDPAGQAPGGDPSPGCYRLPFEGARYRAGEWPRGDRSARASGPCNGEARVDD